MFSVETFLNFIYWIYFIKLTTLFATRCENPIYCMFVCAWVHKVSWQSWVTCVALLNKDCDASSAVCPNTFCCTIKKSSFPSLVLTSVVFIHQGVLSPWVNTLHSGIVWNPLHGLYHLLTNQGGLEEWCWMRWECLCPFCKHVLCLYHGCE